MPLGVPRAEPHLVSTWVIVVDFVVLALGGVLACAAVALAAILSGDSCGGWDDLHRCLLCTMVPQQVGLVVLLLGYLGGLGTATGLLAAADGPHFGAAWLVVAAGIAVTLVLLVVCAWVPRHPIRRRRARRATSAGRLWWRAVLRGPHDGLG